MKLNFSHILKGSCCENHICKDIEKRKNCIQCIQNSKIKCKRREMLIAIDAKFQIYLKQQQIKNNKKNQIQYHW